MNKDNLIEFAKDQCEIFPEDSAMGWYLRETLKTLQAGPYKDAVEWSITDPKNTITKESTAYRRYRDLLEYFGDDSILEDDEEFKKWLERMKWHVRKANELHQKYECQKEQCEDVTGHWFVDERPEGDREIICSNCEQPIFRYHKLDFDYRPNYCPNCGAKMREESEEA